MRPGRGLVDEDIYWELMKVPGINKVLHRSTANVRTDPKTKRRRVEIGEDDWPEVKLAVINWKRFKAGKPQLDALPLTPRQKAAKAEATRVAAEAQAAEVKRAAHRFRKGQAVQVELTGAGHTTHEENVVLRVSKGRVWIEDMDVPFDAQTGYRTEPLTAGFSMCISPVK
jgi:hypothetical protein